MKKYLLPFFALLVTVYASGTALIGHEKLRTKNTFHKPEDVVKYYCGRDSSGFVWSGLLEIERKAFTLWKDLPEQDSFFVAKTYDIKPAKSDPAKPGEQIVEVVYDILGIADAHGTVVPPKEQTRQVAFRLKRDQGVWKIATPDSGVISPVVLASKFSIQLPNLQASFDGVSKSE